MPNENAIVLSAICKEAETVMLNNVNIGVEHFTSSKTHRKSSEWVSELDVCVCSVPRC